MRNLIIVAVAFVFAVTSPATAKIATLKEVFPNRINVYSEEEWSWRFIKKSDPFDDSSLLTARGFSPSGGLIAFHCISGKKLVAVYVPDDQIIAFGPVMVKWRVDKKKALTQDWDMTSQMDSLVAQGSIAHGMALAVIRAQHSLLFGVGGQTSLFWLGDARESVAKVLKGCGRRAA